MFSALRINILKYDVYLPGREVVTGTIYFKHNIKGNHFELSKYGFFQLLEFEGVGADAGSL